VTRLDNPRVEPGDFEAFRKFHEEVAKDYRAWLTLKPVHELEDAPALEAVLALAPGDAASAAILAKLYLLNNRSADARRVLARARYYQPDDANLWELTVKAADTPAEEEKAQRELVKRFPDEARHAVALGSILVQEGKHDQAHAVLEPLTRKGEPTIRAQAHFQLARGFFRKNEFEPALKHLAEAGKADPETVNTARAHQLAGRVCEGLGRVREAIHAYERALVVEPDSEEALDALIRLALARDDPETALTYLRRFTVIVGDEVSGLLLAANYYYRLKHYEEAFELANRARDKTFHEKAQRILGLVYLHRGDFARAATHLDKAELDDEVLDSLIKSYVALGDLRETAARLEMLHKIGTPSASLRKTCDEARRLLQRQADLLKDSPAPAGKEVEWARAAAFVVCAERARQGATPSRPAEALAARAFADDVEFGPTFGLRARLALEKGRLGKALADAERAVKLSSTAANGYYVRGRVRFERNEAGALADLEKAVALSERKDAEMLRGLAEALARAGRRQNALAAQREAVKLNPHDRELKEGLRELEKAAEGATDEP
jgi:tetratricopeptide (TPR) repeat protein